MSTRERWIVYPLLFMTLGIALRDKLIMPVKLGNTGLHVLAKGLFSEEVRTNQLVCNRLIVINPENGRPVAVVGADSSTEAGRIETFNSRGMPQVRLFSSETGGVVAATGYAGKASLMMGATGQNMSLAVEIPQLGLPPIALVPVPSKFEIRTPKAPAEDQNKDAENKPQDTPEKKNEEAQ